MSQSIELLSHTKTITVEEIPKDLPSLYAQENETDPMVYVKYFDPTGSWTWYATEGSPVDEYGLYDTDRDKVDFLFFGYVLGHDAELGYFSFNELANVHKDLNGLDALPIEQDISFTPCRLSEVKQILDI